MKNKIKLGFIILVISIILWLSLGVAIGFYEQIISIGFIPDALFMILGGINMFLTGASTWLLLVGDME